MKMKVTSHTTAFAELGASSGFTTRQNIHQKQGNGRYAALLGLA